MTKPTTKPQLLDTEQTAKHLGITPDELIHQRHRGLSPGIDDFKVDGTLVWAVSALPPKGHHSQI